MSRAFGALGVNKLAPITERVYALILKKGPIRHSILCNAFSRDANHMDMRMIISALRERRLIELEVDPRWHEPSYRQTREKPEK